MFHRPFNSVERIWYHLSLRLFRLRLHSFLATARRRTKVQEMNLKERLGWALRQGLVAKIVVVACVGTVLGASRVEESAPLVLMSAQIAELKPVAVTGSPPVMDPPVIAKPLRKVKRKVVRKWKVRRKPVVLVEELALKP